MRMRPYFWLLLGFAFCEMCLAQPRSPREYYNELRTSHDLPSWASRVCFASDNEVPWFLVIGMNDRSMPVRWYTKAEKKPSSETTYFRRFMNESSEAGWLSVSSASYTTFVYIFRLDTKRDHFWLSADSTGHEISEFQGSCQPIR
jgi:hypothetical protein